MNTNLELNKLPGSKEVYYISDKGSMFITYADLSAENKVIFDEYIAALKTEYSNNLLSFILLNSDAAFNQNLDIIAIVDDNDLSDTFIIDDVEFSALSGDLQTKLTNFINMAESL